MTDQCRWHTGCAYRDDDPDRCPMCHRSWWMILGLDDDHSCEQASSWRSGDLTPRRRRALVRLAQLYRLDAETRLGATRRGDTAPGSQSLGYHPTKGPNRSREPSGGSEST